MRYFWCCSRRPARANEGPVAMGYVVEPDDSWCADLLADVAAVQVQTVDWATIESREEHSFRNAVYMCQCRGVDPPYKEQWVATDSWEVAQKLRVGKEAGMAFKQVGWSTMTWYRGGWMELFDACFKTGQTKIPIQEVLFLAVDKQKFEVVKQRHRHSGSSS